jgi:hypothetical protein
MLRVAAAIAAVTAWDIIFINPKDDRTTMLQFRDLMIAANRPCRLFPQEPYNGWQGDSGALLSLTLGTILGGALSPAIATSLFSATGDSTLITVYITAMSLISWLSTLALTETYRRDLSA